MVPHSAEILDNALAETKPALAPAPLVKLAKDSIRKSLEASTADGIFAAIYSNVTAGVLLTNFVMDLGGSATQIGLLASIPLVANLLQPLGAYLSEQFSSRHWYCLGIYIPSRLVWILLLVGLGLLHGDYITPQTLIIVTLAIALISFGLGALGSAAWLSWMAVLVPKRLRGRYFGLRNSAANLTNLVSVLLMGMAIAQWPSGSVDGFGVLLILAVIFGLASLAFQHLMTDVNPKLQQTLSEPHLEQSSVEIPAQSTAGHPITTEPSKFWILLLYFGGWMFAFSLSAPFFNLYMLDNLKLPITLVTIYTSLMAGANLLMLMFWGRLADRIGNRTVLAIAGSILAITPLLWLFVGTGTLSIWLGLPLLHLVMGGTAAAIDLCNNNLQIGVAPLHKQSTYFGWLAAAAGISGAFGTAIGGYCAEYWTQGGLLGIFIVSSICRGVAIIPLAFVREHRDLSLPQLIQVFTSTVKPAPIDG